MAATEEHGQISLITRILSHSAVAYILPLAVIIIALFVLHDLVSDVSWAEVKADLVEAKFQTLLLAFAATLVSFAGISSYDVLATRHLAPDKVPAHIAFLTGASGNAISNLLGVSYITGTALRYRVYSSLGLEIPTIAGVLAIAWTAFWLALMLVIGVLLIMHPVGLSTVLPLSETVETVIGIGVLATLLALLVILAKRNTFSYGEYTFSLPSHRIAGLLIFAGMVDLVGSALALYVLMPADLVQSFPYFFVIYTAAVGLGLMSHSPGGLGVFEATMIAGLGAAGRSDVLAALLLYRVIYFVLPFLIACVGIAIVYSVTQREKLTGTLSWVYRLVKPLVPMVAAGVAALAGVILVVTGNLPTEVSRLGILREILPFSFIEASHLAASISGLLLIVVARGLYRRLTRAWKVAMILMGIGLIVSLTRGLSWENAGIMLVSMGILALFRPAFYRVEDRAAFRLTGAWILAIIALMTAVFWVGLFAYSHVDYQHALWWQFSVDGDASRFLRASLAVAIMLAVLILDSLLLNRTHKSAERQLIPEAVRRIVSESGDTEANMALMGDKSFLLSDDETAFICYADTGKSLVTKGDPFGDPEQGRELAWRLREKADRLGRRCAFYSVSTEYLPTYLDMGLSIMKIGEVARVDLTDFSLEGSSKRRFRQAKNKAEREDHEFIVIPAAEIEPYLPVLREVSDEWLESKHGTEKGFALGFFDEDYMRNFDQAILRNRETGEIVAFANLFKGANLEELSLDLMRHVPGGPRFAMDALFANLMVWGAEQGYRWFSLGPAPLSGMANRQFATYWNRIGHFIFTHGEHFYNFEGLREYKQKFDPVWSPNYLAAPGGLAVPQVLYEINVLISGGVKGVIR
ncbi:MAG: bifunctional lysylphosphatidylglycerol flippase/synthetase MprF [Rhizobiaceae bacterium]